MPPSSKSDANLLETLTRTNALFRGFDIAWLSTYMSADQLSPEKLYSNRPVYTAFKPDAWLNVLYAVVDGGPVIIRSSPLDRIIALSYAGSCFGMRSLPLGLSQAGRGFPSQVEAYKTTDVIKIPLDALRRLYQESPEFCDRYNHLLELREKFQYHLLNCSTYPPQAVAALLRALIYQERELGSQPDADGIYSFDLPIDIIARATQLNHRTVEQVLKAMQKVKLLALAKSADAPGDMLRILDPEGLKETYSATRDKVSWWPLR